jgi:hypothetical protein
MEKEFIPYELALALKELGFDEPCCSMFMKDILKTRCYCQNSEFNEPHQKIFISAPTYSQAFRFFREKYDLRIWIESNHRVLKFEYVIATTNPNFIDKQFNDLLSYRTHEEAELECLKKLIEISKSQPA